MRVCGVICEYDPFHNGHALHLQRIRALTACDWVVCVMSGCFTQRGHAALVSKWARAEMALRCGADVVFELPTLFALRDAERFARGGVALLDALGVVTHLGFGSESGDIDVLHTSAKVEGNLTAIREGLAQGMSLARARGEALSQDAQAPNDTLGVEYLRALQAISSAIEPVTMRREGGGYHDAAMGNLASATAIRAAIRRGEDVYDAMPPAAYALLRRMLDASAYQQADGLDLLLLATLRSISPEKLAQIADVGEGLENRLLRAAQEATSRQSLLELTKCKRYTWARLSRILTQALLGITKRMVTEQPAPTYARLLGFREDARPLLGEIKKSATVPIITRAAKHRTATNPSLTLDIHAGDIWALGLANTALRIGHTDLTHPVVIIES